MKTQQLAIGFTELLDYIKFRFDEVPADLEVVSVHIHAYQNAIIVVIRSDGFPKVGDYPSCSATAISKPCLLNHLHIEEPAVQQSLIDAAEREGVIGEERV